MDKQSKQLQNALERLTERVAELERDDIKYDMPNDTRTNIQRAVIAGTQYLGILSGVNPPVNEPTPSFLQFNFNGQLWNVPVSANITSGSGAPTFDASKGSVYLRTDTATIYINTNGSTTWSSITTPVLPTGAIMPFGGSSAPTGFLLCDGSSYSTSTYAALYAVIGYTYGGVGSSFLVPDMRANVPVGYKSGDANFGTLGGIAGEATHTLTSAQIPATFATQQNVSLNQGGSSVNPSFAVNTGGGSAHNNIQPSLTVSYIIKT
jgi:microcystin-dependent protein